LLTFFTVYKKKTPVSTPLSLERRQISLRVLPSGYSLGREERVGRVRIMT
jgi:hypothetical protein